MSSASMPALSIHPLTPDRWDDFEALFGDNGACAGCWCMWWKMGQAEWLATKGAGTKRRMRAHVKKGPPPGLLAYAGGTTVGWCAVAPRGDYPRLARSKILAPVDDAPVWSVTCFFVRRDWRRRGVTVALLKEAARWVTRRGGRLVEGYPTDTAKERPAAFVHHGLLRAFTRAGFREVARRSPSRPIVRRRAAVRR
jgi:GNAT superfamily N-acetyltransferase